jgi:hypothetical protein
VDPVSGKQNRNNTLKYHFLWKTGVRRNRPARQPSAVSFGPVADAEDAHGTVLQREQNAVIVETEAE